MAVLTNKSIASTYKSVLSIGATTESALTTSIQQLTDGLGNSSPLSMSTTQIQFNNDANTFSFPADRGTSGQILKLADANGTLSWADDDLSNTLDFSGGTGTGSVTLDSQVLAFTGTTNQIETSASSQAITLSFPTAGVTLPNGSIATTQTASDNSTKVATTAYVEAAVAAGGGGDVTKTGTITANQIAVWNDSTDELRSDETVTIDASGQIDLSQTSSSYNIGGGNINGASYSPIATVTGVNNTGFGEENLDYLTSGYYNTAIGYRALRFSQSASGNTAIGYQSLEYYANDLNHINSVAVGANSGGRNTGGSNTFIGFFSGLGSNTPSNNTGVANSALGGTSLRNLTSGSYNTAIGNNALEDLTTGSRNITLGYSSGSEITTGSYNVIIGSNTGSTIATSSNNIIISDGSGNVRQSFDINGAATFSTGANRTLIIGKDSVDTGYNVVSLNGTTTKGSYSGIAGGGTSDNNLYLNSANNVVVQTGSGFSPSLTISSGGDTTITTTTNQGGLTITSATDNTTLRLINTATSGKDWRLYSTGGSSGLGAGKLFIKVGTTETSARLVSFVDDGSNINVGIGDILPTAKLQIHTETNAGGAEVAAFLVNNSSTINTEVRLAFAANTNDDISTGRYSYISAKNTSGINGQDLVFATNATGASATPKLTISSGGDVTITQPTNGNNAVLNLTAKSAGGNTRTTSLTYDANTEKLIINNAGTEILKMGSSTGVIESNYGIKFGTGTTLDAYEEGTYTATVTLSDAASGTITLSTSYNTLTYTRIGRVVTITGYCYVASVSGSPTGTISINLPFNPASGETFYSAASVEFNNVVSSALNEFWCQVVPNSIQIYRSTGTSVSATTAQQMQTGTDFRVCATYFI